MASGKVRTYEDDVLVDRLARGKCTQAEIGEELGLSEAYVGKVARGERRPELWRRIGMVREAMVTEARALGARHARALVDRHIKEGLGGKTETARKCREFALRTCCFGELRKVPAQSPAMRWSPVFGRVRAWDDVDALLGPSDEADEEGVSGGAKPQKAKGQFFDETAQTTDPLRAADLGAGEAQAKDPQGFTADDAGGEVNVSDGPTL